MRFRYRLAQASCLTALVSLAACSDDSTSADETTGDSDDLTPPEFDGLESMVAVEDNGLQLQWSAASDDQSEASAIAYRIYLAESPGAQDFSSPELEVDAGTTSVVLPDRDYGTTYYAVVRAVDEAGNEDDNQSERVATAGNLSAPDFGGALNVEVIDGTSIRVLWNPADDAETATGDITYAVYVVEQGNPIDWETPTLVTEPGAAMAVVDGLSDCVTYSVAVRARDEFDWADDNELVLEATTLDATAPNFGGVTSVTMSGGGAFIEWTPGNDACVNGADLDYNVYAATTSGGQDFSTPTAEVTASEFNTVVAGLDLSTEYFFVVRSVDPAGNEDTNEVELSGLTAGVSDEQPPVFFGALLALGESPSSISLAWDMASDDQSTPEQIIYDIYVSEQPGGQDFGSAPQLSTAPGETTALVSGLVPETQYYFVVRARDATGNQEGNTTEVSATTGTDDIPPTFAGVQQVVAVGPQTIEASWLAATDDGSLPAEITYEVYLATDTGSFDYDSPVQVVPNGQTVAVLTDLQPSTQYYVSVRAIDKRDNKETNTVEGEDTTWDDVIAPTFGPNPSTSPQGLTEIFVDWTDATDDIDPANEIRYEVFTSLTPGGFDFGTPALSPATGITEGTLTGLFPGTNYYIIVRAYDEAGNFDDSNVVQQATNADTEAPTFDGAFQIIGASANTLTAAWNEATDNFSDAANITYTLCLSTSPAGCIGNNFSADAVVTGATQYTFDNNLPVNHGILVSTTYFVVVRAQDQFGNQETNSVVITGSTVPDTTPPTWDDGTSNIQATAVNEGRIDLTWSAASDDVTTDPANIAYDIYFNAGSAPGFGAENLTVVGTTSAQVTGLDPATNYFFAVRARDLAGNRTQNTDTDTATTPADNTPPTDGTVNDLTATGCAEILVEWTEANDLGTTAGDMIYDICVGDVSTCGGTAFSVTDTVVGTTSTTVNVASAGNYYVKVRARDTSGNSSTNNTFLQVNTGSQDAGSPTQPGSLTLTTFTNDPDRINVDWAGSTDSCFAANTLDYQICTSTSPAGCQASNWVTATTVNNNGGGATTADDVILAQNTFYFVGVRAVDDQGNASTPVRKSTTTPVSWEQSGLRQKMVDDCDGCHDEVDTGWSYNEMVGIDSGCGGQLYINPGNASSSYVYLRVSTTAVACSVGQMPDGCDVSGTCWDNAWTTTLYDWIQQGAVENN